MEPTYTTSQVAKMIGIHANTVRLYEELGLISTPERKANNYRVFNQWHIEQFRMARLAFQVEVLQNGLRKEAVAIVKTIAAGDLNAAMEQARAYLLHIHREKEHAEEAIEITEQLLSGGSNLTEKLSLTRKETADYLGVTIDTLRNWELNGLLSVKRKENGYRIYTDTDLERLKIIRSLRCANYSLAAILRMLNDLSQNPETDIREAINTPKQDDDIITACDQLLTSLELAAQNVKKICEILENRINPPL